MFTQICMCLMFVTMIYHNMVNVVSATSTDMEQLEQKRSSPAFFGRFGVDPSYFLNNHPYYDDDLDQHVAFLNKQQLKKKWAKFIQRSQSPYTIAFPALIRTRRSIE